LRKNGVRDINFKTGKAVPLLQLKKFFLVIKSILQKNNGQTLMEYALIIFFVIIAVIVSLTLFGNQLMQLWQSIVGSF